MILILIAALVAGAALGGLWLWTRPDVRAWLACHWARVWQAVEPYRGRMLAAAVGLAIGLLLFLQGVWAALPWAITVATIWWCQWATRDADETARAADDQVASLAAAANRIAATRDAYADALNDVLASDDLDTAQARARTALETRSYAGDLAAARAGHEAAELELRDALAELADMRAWATGQEDSATKTNLIHVTKETNDQA